MGNGSPVPYFCLMSPRRLLVLICISASVSCSEPERPVIPAGRFPDAAAYNDYILSLNDSVAGEYGRLARALSEKGPREARAAIDSLRHRCRIAIDSMQALQDWHGDSSLRVAAVSLFGAYDKAAAFYPGLLPILYTEDAVDTSKVTDTIPENDSSDPNSKLIPKYEAVMRRISRLEEDARRQFYDAQYAFAEKYKVRTALRRRVEEE